MEQNSPKPDFIFPDTGLQTILKTYDEVIAHYDFVIADISSEIYNPSLRINRPQAVAFLKAMRNEWQKCKEDVQQQIDALNQQHSK